MLSETSLSWKEFLDNSSFLFLHMFCRSFWAWAKTFSKISCSVCCSALDPCSSIGSSAVVTCVEIEDIPSLAISRPTRFADHAAVPSTKHWRDRPLTQNPPELFSFSFLYFHPVSCIAWASLCSSALRSLQSLEDGVLGTKITDLTLSARLFLAPTGAQDGH